MASQWFWKHLNGGRVNEEIDSEKKETPFPGPFSAVVSGRIESSPGAPRGVTITQTESTTLSISWRAPEVDHGGVVQSFAIRYRLATDAHWTETSALSVAQVVRPENHHERKNTAAATLLSNSSFQHQVT